LPSAMCIKNLLGDLLESIFLHRRLGGSASGPEESSTTSTPSFQKIIITEFLVLVKYPWSRSRREKCILPPYHEGYKWPFLRCQLPCKHGETIRL